ncbi:alpha/beta hydrolase [Jeotgalibacillus marinus]|uniref:Alpha/beta hydrolase n=1 Tax=Jeotgalibacillus marinus TaxID=86667 RepID=A0ABV3Q1I2_9BACL
MDQSFFCASDGMEIYVRKWFAKDGKAKGVVQLSHGMVEHIERYEEFAQFLTTKGFLVVGHDQRGHGQTALRNGTRGYLGDGDGFQRLVDDVKEINDSIHRDYSLPVFLLGHSMGSFVARRFIQLHDNQIDGVMLSGTGGPKGLLGEVGKIVAKGVSMWNSPLAPGYLLSKLTFGPFNKGFAPSKTDFDWLCRDENEVDCYLHDPMCGFACTNKFYVDLFNGISIIHKKNEIKKMDPTLPIMLLSGSADPVGTEGNGVFAVAKLYKKAGMKDVEVHLYEDCRHEILKETNRQVVFNDILSKLNEWTEVGAKRVGT